MWITIPQIRFDGFQVKLIRYLANRKVGEKTVEGIGYEPYEAVKYFLGNLMGQL